MKKPVLGFGRETSSFWKMGFGKKQEQEAGTLPVMMQEEDKEEGLCFPTEILFREEGIRGILMYQGMEALPDFKLDKEIFLIGKNEKEVDGVIGMKCISRIHARITQEQDEYYLEDMNSTNGTFLNGQILEYREKVKLKERDRIAFGTVEYLFL